MMIFLKFLPSQVLQSVELPIKTRNPSVSLNILIHVKATRRTKIDAKTNLAMIVIVVDYSK